MSFQLLNEAERSLKNLEEPSQEMFEGSQLLCLCSLTSATFHLVHVQHSLASIPRPHGDFCPPEWTLGQAAVLHLLSGGLDLLVHPAASDVPLLVSPLLPPGQLLENPGPRFCQGF